MEEGKYRSRFTNRWNRVSSDEITVSFYSDLTQVEKYLNDAEPTNEKIYREMVSVSNHFFSKIKFLVFVFFLEYCAVRNSFLYCSQFKLVTII